MDWAADVAAWRAIGDGSEIGAIGSELTPARERDSLEAQPWRKADHVNLRGSALRARFPKER